MAFKLGAVMLFHDDPAAHARWYEEMLRFPKGEAWGDDHVGVMAGELYYGFNKPREGPRPGPGWIQLFFDSSDCDGDFAAIRDKGAEVLQEPKTEDWGGRTACFRDPAGNHVWLMQHLQ